TERRAPRRRAGEGRGAGVEVRGLEGSRRVQRVVGDLHLLVARKDRRVRQGDAPERGYGLEVRAQHHELVGVGGIDAVRGHRREGGGVHDAGRGVEVDHAKGRGRRVEVRQGRDGAGGIEEANVVDEVRRAVRSGFSQPEVGGAGGDGGDQGLRVRACRRRGGQIDGDGRPG